LKKARSEECAAKKPQPMCAQFDEREGHTRSTKSLGGVRISQEKPSQKLAPADLSADPP
jgi:hypothetical protein